MKTLSIKKSYLKHRKFLVFLIIVFISLFSFGQNSEITYKISRDYSGLDDKNLGMSAKTKIKGIYNALNNIECVLVYNKDFGVFREVEKMEYDNDPYQKMASIFVGGTYYCDRTKQKFVKQKEFSGKLFNIQLEYKSLDWEITKDKREIGGYTCYKAILKSDEAIIVWFAPELNFPFGPIGMGGLPGLILELTKNKLIFSATKISLGNNTEVLELPTEGEFITEDAYSKLVKSNTEFLFGN
ncbi:GLPGLI family protein [Formosa sp. 3Alg 14/1]|uniref:GLPGLI family protein n=1 Tax=unclassified Formosa TaxID=2644710 RepID=UPI0039BDDFDC